MRMSKFVDPQQRSHLSLQLRIQNAAVMLDFMVRFFFRRAKILNHSHGGQSAAAPSSLMAAISEKAHAR
jgi:hypothetical protein